MTKDQAIRLAIKTLKKTATEYYGWSAKFQPNARKAWEEYMEAVQILLSLMDKPPPKKE